MKYEGYLIYVRSIDRSIDFYRKLFHFRETYRKGDDFAIMEGCGAKIHLHRDCEKFEGNLAGLELKRIRGDGVIFHFHTSNVDAWADRCKVLGYALSLPPTSMPFGQRQCYVYDPDGYNIVAYSEDHHGEEA